MVQFARRQADKSIVSFSLLQIQPMSSMAHPLVGITGIIHCSYYQLSQFSMSIRKSVYRAYTAWRKVGDGQTSLLESGSEGSMIEEYREPDAGGHVFAQTHDEKAPLWDRGKYDA